MSKIKNYVFSKIFPWKSINDINYQRPSIDISIRKNFRVLFIDDNELNVLDDLRHEYKYDITYKKIKLDSIYDAEAYDIVLCDLDGVQPESELQGAKLVKDIRTAYPSKQIIMYTAHNLTMDQMEIVLKSADKRIRKGVRIEHWEAILDECILDLIDPTLAWIKIKKFLEDKQVKTIDIARFENIFVNSYLSGKTENIKDLAKEFSYQKNTDEIIKVLIPILSKIISMKGVIR